MTPAAQTARRVCLTAAGYTLGTATPEGPRLYHGRAPVRKREADHPAPVTRTTVQRPAPIAMSLLAELERLGPGGVLPPISHVGRAIGLNTPMEQMTSHVCLHFRTLCDRDLIAWWRGSDHGFKGQYAVRIVGTGHTLRTAGCPAWATP